MKKKGQSELRNIMIALLVASMFLGGFKIYFQAAEDSYNVDLNSRILSDGNGSTYNLTDTVNLQLKNTTDILQTKIAETASADLSLGFWGTLTLVKDLIFGLPTLVVDFFSVTQIGLGSEIPPEFLATIAAIFVIIIIWGIIVLITKVR